MHEILTTPDNHKPALSAGTRTTTLQSSSGNSYNLSLRDAKKSGDNDMFVFNGSRTAPAKSYVLLFDQTTQKATLERLDSTYTFNLSTKNGADVSADYGKIYPKKAHKDSVHDKEEGEVDLFGEEQGDDADEGTEPDAANPYDFRHFLNAVKSKRDTAEERGYASSPDYRSNTATSTANTPTLPARRPEPLAKKRKAASVFASKPAAKGAPKKSSAPTINLERRASDRPAPPSQTKSAAPAAASSKIKSAEFVQESDDSDIDAEGEPDSNVPTPKHRPARSPSPGHRTDDSQDAPGSEDDGSASDGGLEIEVPDARPRHLAPGRGVGAAARSPSQNPVSLASAANSVEGTPRRGVPAEEIDFGDFELEGEDDDADADGDDGDVYMGDDGDGDVERMDIGPPARQDSRKSVSGAAGVNAAAAAEVDEDDPLYMEMMEGLAGGESSEESEEE